MTVMAQQTNGDGGLGLGAGPLPTVLLLHELPDSTQHVDWMIARDAAGTLPLVSFRVQQPLTLLVSGASAVALRINDHRPAYLQYEGEISQNRGRITRLASGSVLFHAVSSNDAGGACTIGLQIHWQEVRDIALLSQQQILQKLRLNQQNSSQWLVICDSMEAQGASAPRL